MQTNRSIFTDQWNSVAHVGIGAAAYVAYTQEITGVYVLYQVSTSRQNLVVDLLEFAAGYGLAMLLTQFAS